MNYMKLIVLLSFLSFIGSSDQLARAQSNAQTRTANAGEVILLNKKDFLEKVYNFEKSPETWVYEGNKPCIIDFYADWCGPCKKIAPILKDLAKEYQSQLIIYKVNVDKERDLAYTFGIQSIPAILFVPAKGKPKMSTGALPREEFVKQINDFLLGK